ncbi:hypothetical protein FS320_24765 [Microvirga tunisiensis]|uniref:Integrase n=1 Tax=Microvirga tunisiensis TaxID=2108360 RepID=A0A5N7MNP9_9HYPH|nr:hypothetical protein [Microvirga tunisiensis]MPR10989.1 hypothetical protein [Microvirga tunisiensis]MPR28280.1 hypothetical protein [Microvirga tunisiensis]
MADVIREALIRIRRETEEARRMARWYEENPDRLYLPPELSHLRSKQFLTMTEVGSLYFGSSANNYEVRKWLNKQGIPTPSMKGADNRDIAHVAFAEFEHLIVSLLPLGFPVRDAATGMRYSESLFVIPFKHFSRSGRNGTACMFEPVSYGQVYLSLGGNDKIKSVFQKTGLDPDGRLKVSTHQFRHYLNTIAHTGGLSQIDIAKWSGRKNVSQNSAYDHLSSAEILNKLRSQVGDENLTVGPLAEMPANLPVSREKFSELAIPTAHVTKYGFCVHDFAASPCEMFRRCLSCTEHLCIKGDEAKSARIREQLQMGRQSLRRAQEAVVEEVYGAFDWVEIHAKTVSRLEQLVAILDDASVPAGTIIQLNNSGNLTLSAQALKDRDLLDSPTGAGLQASNQNRIEITHG